MAGGRLRRWVFSAVLNNTEALAGCAAGRVFNFDKSHLDRCDAAVLALPGGKSAHLELGHMTGKWKEKIRSLRQRT